MNVAKLDSLKALSPTYQRGFGDGHKLGFQEGKLAAHKIELRTSLALIGIGAAIGGFWNLIWRLMR